MAAYAKVPLPGFPTTSLQESVGVSSLHFVMPWFLTLFSSLPCWDSVLAVWDLIILSGNYTHKCRICQTSRKSQLLLSIFYYYLRLFGLVNKVCSIVVIVWSAISQLSHALHCHFKWPWFMSSLPGSTCFAPSCSNIFRHWSLSQPPLRGHVENIAEVRGGVNGGCSSQLCCSYSGSQACQLCSAPPWPSWSSWSLNWWIWTMREQCCPCCSGFLLTCE